MSFKLLIVFACLATVRSGTVVKRLTCPDGVNTVTNAACCPLFALRDDLQNNLFFNECSFNSCQAVRLAFHDAIGFSQSGALKGQGADGSLLTFASTELQADANAALVDDVNSLLPFLSKHPNVTAGDLVQFAAAVGLANCAGAPRVQFLLGRPPAKVAASNGTIPQPQDSVTSILNRFADAGFAPAEVVSLLAAHSIARQDSPGVLALDTTPFTFDTQFFLEVLLKGVGFSNVAGATGVGNVAVPLPSAGLLRLQSDFALARDSRTACPWQQNINNEQLMLNNFRNAFQKLAVVGQNVAGLVDCSGVVPVPPVASAKPASFPAGTNLGNLERACASAPFPSLAADPGPATSIPACPNGQPDPEDCP